MVDLTHGIARHDIRGVVILSGDAHLAGYTEVQLRANGFAPTLRRL